MRTCNHDFSRVTEVTEMHVTCTNILYLTILTLCIDFVYTKVEVIEVGFALRMFISSSNPEFSATISLQLVTHIKLHESQFY